MEDSFFSYFDEPKSDTTKEEKEPKKVTTQEIKKSRKSKKKTSSDESSPFLTIEKLNQLYGDCYDSHNVCTERMGVTINDEYQTFLSYNSQVLLKELKIKLTQLSKMNISVGNKIVIKGSKNGKVEIVLYPTDSLDYVSYGIIEDSLEYPHVEETSEITTMDKETTMIKEMLEENGVDSSSENITDFFLMIYHVSLLYMNELIDEIKKSNKISEMYKLDFSDTESFCHYFNGILTSRMKTISNFMLLFAPLTKEMFSDTNNYSQFKYVYDFYLTTLFNICNNEWVKILFCSYEKFVKDNNIEDISLRVAHSFEKIPTDLDDVNDLIFSYSVSLYDSVDHMLKYKNMITDIQENAEYLDGDVGFERWLIEGQRGRYNLDDPDYDKETIKSEEDLNKKNLCLSFFKTFYEMYMKISSFVTYDSVSGESYYTNEFITIDENDENEFTYNEKLLMRAKQLNPRMEKLVCSYFTEITTHTKEPKTPYEIHMTLMNLANKIVFDVMNDKKANENKEQIEMSANLHTLTWGALIKLMLVCSYVC